MTYNKMGSKWTTLKVDYTGVVAKNLHFSIALLESVFYFLKNSGKDYSF